MKVRPHSSTSTHARPVANRPQWLADSWLIHGLCEDEAGGLDWAVDLSRLCALPAAGALTILTRDRTTGRECVVSRITPALEDWLASAGSDAFRDAGLDEDVVEAMRQQLHTLGPSRPFVVDHRLPEVRLNPLTVRWADFSLEQAGEGLSLRFQDGLGGEWQLHLSGEFSQAHRAFRGSVAEEPVRGEAWVTSSSAQAGGLVPDAGKPDRLDRFRFVLDDGSLWTVTSTPDDLDHGSPAAVVVRD